MYKELKVFIEKKIAELKLKGLKDWNSITILVSEVVQEVERIYGAYFGGQKISEEKKEAAKKAIYKIIDSVPIPIKLFKIPIPQFLVKSIIKMMVGKIIDQAVAYYNNSGKFTHLA